MTLQEYIENSLPYEVSNYLYKFNPEIYPMTKKLYSRDGYFYEGTVRAVIATFLQNFIMTNQSTYSGYLVLSEQPFDGLARQRADIVAANLNAKNPFDIVIEVKADFNIDSAYNDMSKLLEQTQEENIENGYVFFMAKDLTTAIEQSKKLDKSVGNPDNLKAIGIPATPTA